MSPESEPATLRDVPSMMSAPVPLLTFAMPSPIESAAFATTMRVSFPPAAFVTCSNAKSPLMICPPTVRFTSRASTRIYGPAGRSISMLSPPMTTDSVTAAVEVLMLTPNVPLSDAPVTSSATFAVSEAATPEARKMILPRPAVTFTNGVASGPNLRPTSVTAMRVIFAPASSVTCSTTNLPVMVCPAIVSEAATVSPMATRRYGPAGRSSGAGTATAVLLMSNATVPSNATPGTLICARTERRAAMPSFERRRLPEPSLSLTKSVAPSPNAALTLLALTVISSAPFANEKSPVSD